MISLALNILMLCNVLGFSHPYKIRVVAITTQSSICTWSGQVILINVEMGKGCELAHRNVSLLLESFIQAGVVSCGL